MPSANGVFSLVPGYLATTGTTILASQHNPPLEDIAEGLTGRLSRDGSAPMTGALKLASGSVGAPGATFNSDTATGFYKTTSGIGVAVGGTKVAEFAAGGMASGSRFLGELIPYAGATAPPLTVFPFGQTLSRAAYADLWAFAQIQIAASSTFFNNGDGTTTFGIGDLRGRVPFGGDAMGGVAASRLTTANSGVDGATTGAVGGSPNQTVAQANLPSVNFAVTLPTIGVPAEGKTVSSLPQSFTDTTVVPQGPAGGSASGDIPVRLTGSATAASGGSGTALKTQPSTIVLNYILFAGA